jgi:large subunit ribosomal protein L37e
MAKGITASFGKQSKQLHMHCRRCGEKTYHMKKKVCSSCGYGKSAKIRKYSWQKPGKRSM